MGLVFALILSGLMWLVGGLLFSEYGLGVAVALATFSQIILSISIGSLIPLAFHRIGLDPTTASLPLFTVIADLSAVGILFGFFNSMVRI